MIHAGQFAILKTGIELPEYHCVSLQKGWTLSYHEKLRVYRGGDGRFLLLGIAWQTAPDRQSPREEIERLAAAYGEDVPSDRIRDMEETWCGRYVLLYRDTVYLDASGLLPVFYSADGIASDCTLLALSMGREEILHSARKGINLNWMPGPLTQYDEIQRLMPDQIYHFYSGVVESRQLLAQSYEWIENEDDLIRRFIRCFDASLNNLAAALPGKKILIALTGGRDSKSLFALAKHAGIDFSAFTLWHTEISAGDIEVPKQICDRTKTEHYYGLRDPEKYREDLSLDYLHHTAGLVKDTDQDFYAYGQYQEMLRRYGNSVLLRSSIWANAMEMYRRVINDDGLSFDFYPWFGVQEGSLEMRSLKAYFAWEQAHPQEGLCNANRFMWNQRHGCWTSPLESGFDLLDSAVSLQPLNSRYLLSMVMNFPREERLTRQYQVKIISAACPAIAEIPFGTEKRSQEPPGSQFIQKAGRGVHRLRTLGLKNTWRTYLSMIQDRRELNDLKRKTEKRD